MRARWLLALLWASFMSASVSVAQEAPAAKPVAPPANTQAPKPISPPPSAQAVAATVNGQSIPELTVYRALLREDPRNHERARKEVLNYLIENALVDQYLVQLKIPVDAKEVEEKIQQVKKEATASGGKFEDILKRLLLTEDELRKEMGFALRWDKFVAQQAKEAALKELFEKNKDMFNGSQMQARHILITVAGGTQEQALVRLAVIKKQVEAEVAAETGKVPPGTDAASAEKARIKALENAFAKAAKEASACPSKENGGDVGWFPRSGAMVEPFARAAFALKPYQLSDAVVTDFGYHLILATDRKPGRDVKFEDVRAFVIEVYSERLREAVIAAMKPNAKILLQPMGQ